jgi:hypothetical protein
VIDGWLCEEDAFAEEVAVGSAVHLSFDHLDAVDVSFDPAGVPLQGEARFDGVEVAVEAVGEAA